MYLVVIIIVIIVLYRRRVAIADEENNVKPVNTTEGDIMVKEAPVENYISNISNESFGDPIANQKDFVLPIESLEM